MLQTDLLEKYIDEYYSQFKGLNRAGIQQCRDEIEQVIDYIGDRKFNVMCEIGVDYGGSFWLYANLFLNKNNGQFNLIDPKIKLIVYKMKDIFKNRYKEVEIDIIPLPSQHVCVTEIDFLHIDGDHDYESVKRDFKRFYPEVIRGGVILLHDTLLHDGAIKFRKELEDSNKYNMRTFKGHDLISGDFGIEGENLSTGITLIQK